MISELTEPGTRVVALITTPKWVPSDFALVKGNAYTVSYMMPTKGGDISVQLEGFPHNTSVLIRGQRGMWNYPRSIFKLAPLPQAITDTLTAYPADVAKEIERADREETLRAEVKEWLRVILPPL